MPRIVIDLSGLRRIISRPTLTISPHPTGDFRVDFLWIRVASHGSHKHYCYPQNFFSKLGLRGTQRYVSVPLRWSAPKGAAEGSDSHRVHARRKGQGSPGGAAVLERDKPILQFFETLVNNFISQLILFPFEEASNAGFFPKI